MVLEWIDECEENPALCDNNITTFEYVIKYNVAGCETVYTRRIPVPASQHTLDGLNANNDYEITMMIVAKESKVYSDQSQVACGTTSE